MKTKCIKWTPESGFSDRDLEEAKEVIRRGGLVAFPTETVYGLGGNGLLPEAAKKIYAAKGRPSDNPLILHIARKEQLADIVQQVTEPAVKLAEAFWPGPLTMILDKAANIPYETTGGLDTVAVRMPEHRGALAFLERAGVPVAAPSANLSGRPSPTRAEHVREDLDGRIDMIIDGGEVGIGLESTIVDLTEEIPVILRPGSVTKQMLEHVIGEVRTDPAIVENTRPAEEKKSEMPEEERVLHPKAPGMKYRHYAPKAPMTVFRGDEEAVAARIENLAATYCREGTYCAEEIGILTTEETKHHYPFGQVVSVGSRKQHTVGRYLYEALRKFDELHVKTILSESFYGLEQEEAIMNRLLKAAGQHVVDVK